MQFSLKLRAVNKENSKMLGHYIIMSVGLSKIMKTFDSELLK